MYFCDLGVGQDLVSILAKIRIIMEKVATFDI